MVLGNTCAENQVYPVGAYDTALAIGHGGIGKLVGVAAIVQPSTILDVSKLLRCQRLQEFGGRVEAEVEVVGQLRLAGITRVGGDKDYACSCPGAVHGTGGRIFQDVNRLDVGWVDICYGVIVGVRCDVTGVDGHAIDHIKRCHT